MTKYKLDLSYHKDGSVQLHVFDLSSEESGPVETCTIGDGLDSGELREAWMRFMHDTSSDSGWCEGFGTLDADEAEELGQWIREYHGTDDNEKADVYRRWRRGGLSDDEVREVFKDDFEEVQKLARNDEIVRDTPDPEPDNNELFFDRLSDRDDGEDEV